MFLKIEKTGDENTSFVLLLLLLLSFSSRITQKLYGIYKCSAYQTTALLLDMCLSWFRAVCEIRQVSYIPFCALLGTLLRKAVSTHPDILVSIRNRYHPSNRHHPSNSGC